MFIDEPDTFFNNEYVLFKNRIYFSFTIANASILYLTTRPQTHPLLSSEFDKKNWFLHTTTAASTANLLNHTNYSAT